jgi:histone H4
MNTGVSARGGKGKVAKGIAKRHRKQAAASEQISKSAIRRIARRAGVRRVGGGCFNDINNAGRTYIKDVLSIAFVYATHAKRKTITCSDILYSLKRMGVKYMGY